MAENRLSRLAGKMKQDIEREELRRKAAEDARAKADAERRESESRQAKRRAEAQKARRALLADIAAFGSELGHLRVASDDDGVTLSFRGAEVRFEAEGPEDRIAIRLPAEVVPRNHHLSRDDGEWEMVFDHGTVVRRFTLEEGIEEVLRNHLLVPLPTADQTPAAPAPAPEPESKGRRKGKGGKVTPGSGLQELKGPLD